MLPIVLAMARPTFPLANRALNGELPDRLKAGRDAGKSYETIARELAIDLGEVSAETVRKWCREQGLTAKASTA